MNFKWGIVLSEGMSELLGISAKVIWSDKEILWEAFMDLFGGDGKALNGALFIGERMEI